jgi:hypothetical protein
LTLLPEAELAAMRTTLEETFPSTARILRQTFGSDGQGGQTTDWGTAIGTVACRISPLSGEEGDLPGRAGVEATSQWIATFPAGTDIHPLDFLEVTDPAGHTWALEVVALRGGDRSPRSWELSTRVVCLEAAVGGQTP